MSEIVALQHATLIDGTGRPPVPDATVLIADGLISAAGPTASVPVPSEAQVRDYIDRSSLATERLLADDPGEAD